MQKKSPYGFHEGLRDGLPIGLGYFSVAFSIGLLAVSKYLSAAMATVISAACLTSAGEVAGISIIAALGGVSEMALSQLVINLRYALMSISLSQKLEPGFSVPQRMIAAYGITDEIFAVASTKEHSISARYMYGLILLPMIGWTIGTLVGALAGDILPSALCNALSIAIYGMFIAIVVPPAREKKSVCICALMAAAFSVLLYVVFASLSDGFRIIICAVLAAGIAALVWPVEEAAEE